MNSMRSVRPEVEFRKILLALFFLYILEDRKSEKKETEEGMNEDRNPMKNDRFAAYVGIELKEMRPGYALVDMDVEEKHLNGLDMIQGGVIFTLADFAFAAASNAGGQVTVGINVSVSYLKASKGKKLRAIAQEVAASRRIGNYKIDVYDENNDHIAQLIAIGYRKGKS